MILIKLCQNLRKIAQEINNLDRLSHYLSYGPCTQEPCNTRMQWVLSSVSSLGVHYCQLSTAFRYATHSAGVIALAMVSLSRYCNLRWQLRGRPCLGPAMHYVCLAMPWTLSIVSLTSSLHIVRN